MTDWTSDNRLHSTRKRLAVATDTFDGPDPDAVLAEHAPWADSQLRADADAYAADLQAEEDEYWERRMEGRRREWDDFEDERNWAWD